ncbi:MAG: YlzJ-like family protein [Clostridia bacterium]|nr:YlzJ-like family protein [Clostridia bacterium]
MLYTIVPAEFVFSEAFKLQPPVETLCLKNGLLETKRTEQGREILRLISTNPKDYLNPRYNMGEKI